MSFTIIQHGMSTNFIKKLIMLTRYLTSLPDVYSPDITVYICKKHNYKKNYRIEPIMKYSVWGGV